MKKHTLLKVALTGGPVTDLPLHHGGGGSPIYRSGADIAIQKNKTMDSLIQKMKNSSSRIEKSQRFNLIKNKLGNPASKIKLK